MRGLHLPIGVALARECTNNVMDTLPHRGWGLTEIHVAGRSEDFAEQCFVNRLIIGDQTDTIERLPDETWNTIDVGSHVKHLGSGLLGFT